MPAELSAEWGGLRVSEPGGAPGTGSPAAPQSGSPAGPVVLLGADDDVGVARWGADVRAAREAAGMTLEQVSERTRIRPAVLRELEAGSTARAGGAAYARGHLRAVAAVTGADPALLLAAHDRSGGGTGAAAAGGATAAGGAAAAPGRGVRAVAREPAVPVLARGAAERTGPRWGVAGIGAALVLLVLLLVGRLLGGGGPAPEALTPAAPGSVVVTASAAPVVSAALRLRVAGAPSWVQVLTSGGTSLFTGVLGAGAAREFHDPSALRVVVGNAGAVTVGCAGRDTPAGARGQVRRYTCAASGLAPA